MAEQITEQNSESDCLPPLVEQTEELCGHAPDRVLADEGFGAGYELEELGGKGVAVFIPMGKVSIALRVVFSGSDGLSVAY